MKPKVYIVITNWKDYENLIELLESLKRISYPGYQVVVVDTEPQEERAQRLRQRYGDHIHWLSNEKDLGFAANCNVGMRYVLDEGANYVLTLDSDTVVTPSFLDKLMRTIESDPKIGIVQSRICLFYHSPETLDPSENRFGGLWTCLIPELQVIKGWLQGRREPGEVTPLWYFSNTASLIRREVFEKIGLLDPIFFYGADNLDFGVRASQAGYRLLFVPDSQIYHKHKTVQGMKARMKPFHMYYINRGRIIFVRKNYHWTLRLLYYAIVFAALMPKSVLGYSIIRNRSFRLGWAYVRGVFDGLTIKYKKAE